MRAQNSIIERDESKSQCNNQLTNGRGEDPKKEIEFQVEGWSRHQCKSNSICCTLKSSSKIKFSKCEDKQIQVWTNQGANACRCFQWAQRRCLGELRGPSLRIIRCAMMMPSVKEREHKWNKLLRIFQPISFKYLTHALTPQIIRFSKSPTITLMPRNSISLSGPCIYDARCQIILQLVLWLILLTWDNLQVILSHGAIYFSSLNLFLV